MAVGKSIVGQKLAQRLKRPFVDLDHAIEEAEGMKVEEIATTQYYQRLFGGDFEMMLSFSGRAHKDPGSVWLIQPAYAPGGNMLGWKSDAYEDLLKQGASTFDREKRKAIYRKVQEILLEESFELILARRYTYYGIRKDRLHDFRFGIDGDWYMHRAWIG